MPAAEGYEPAYDLGSGAVAVVAAQTANDLLDRWHTQTAIPISTTPMGLWLMADADYTPPAPAEPQPSAPTTGRLWPRR